MIEVPIKCRHIEGWGRRLGYSLSDVGIENVNDEELDRRIDELREELDMRTIEDGAIVDTVTLDEEP